MIGRWVLRMPVLRDTLLVAAWRTALEDVDANELDLRDEREAFCAKTRAFIVATDAIMTISRPICPPTDE